MRSSRDRENLAPQILTQIAKQIRKLASDPPEGVKYLPQKQGRHALTEIHAQLDGPEGTPYAGGYFHIKLVIGPDFPQSPPVIHSRLTVNLFFF